MVFKGLRFTPGIPLISILLIIVYKIKSCTFVLITLNLYIYIYISLLQQDLNFILSLLYRQAIAWHHLLLVLLLGHLSGSESFGVSIKLLSFMQSLACEEKHTERSLNYAGIILFGHVWQRLFNFVQFPVYGVYPMFSVIV